MVRKYIKPLLADHPDIEIVNRCLVIKPIHHILRYVLIVSWNADRHFWPQWDMKHLCEPYGISPYWGDLMSGDYDWGDTVSAPRFMKELERNILPRLRKLQTLDDLVEQIHTAPIPRTRMYIDPLRGITLHAARGDLAAARRDMEKLRQHGTFWSVFGVPDEGLAEVIRTFGAILDAEDRPAIARQLHEWEAARVAGLPKGFARLWQPTPFPIETQSSPLTAGVTI